MADLAIILTVRSDSDRLKDKCFIEIKKRPLIYWIIKRLQKIKRSQVVLATTHFPSDDRLAELGESMSIPVYRGDSRDVVVRVNNALRFKVPEAKFVFRALGDMPFIATEIVDRAVEVLSANPQKEAMLWHLPPDIWPLYGAREFPYSRSGWDKIFKRSYDSTEREHTDMFFHQNRRSFNIVYHEPPGREYFRPYYRLEVDYKEDAQFIQAVGSKIGMLRSFKSIIKFLDQNPEIAAINREKVEKTGVSSYLYQQQRVWWALMKGQPELDWNDKWWSPMNGDQVPQFCHQGHLLGYAQGGILYTKDGETQIEAGKVKCPVEGCGSSKIWHLAKDRGARG